MRILILGGGVFLGAAALHVALSRGHAVTVFNRGRSRASWPAGVQVLTGDRTVDMPALAQASQQPWDAVIDTCGYVPQDVQASVEVLRGCGRYLFVSSVSAYASFAHAPILETDPLSSAVGVGRADRDPQHYGAQKAACEAEVAQALGERALIVRPGLIVGPGDPTGRFSYWPWRVAAGGDVLVPAVDRAAPLQLIDVRDLAEWMVLLLERGASGTFNATGPASASGCDWTSLLAACADEARARGAPPARLVAVGEKFLVDQGVDPWNELPLWLPPVDASLAGFMRVSVQHARAHGMSTRPLRDTLAAVLDEPVPGPADKRRKGKLAPQREAELLAQWRATGGSPGA